MFRSTILFTLTTMVISGCSKDNKMPVTSSMKKEIMQDSIIGYAPVNGLKMYYEIHGKGEPLVLIHGGGSTIQTTFGRVLHAFASDRQVIAVELQAHGRTADIDRPLSFEQDADDVAALLKYLKIDKADFFGFSNGGNTTMQIAIRHLELVRKIIVASAFYKREGMYPQFWEFMKNTDLSEMPQKLQEAYKKVAPNPDDLVIMCNKDITRMVTFKDWTDDDIRSIKAPAFILLGDQDVVLPEHAVKMMRLMPHARLSILPGVHGEYLGEIEAFKEGSKLPSLTVAMVEEFLNEDVGPKTKDLH